MEELIKQEELSKILEAHKHYLKQDCEGWENMRADLRRADLRYADLGDADLMSANLMSANLGGANLINADISGAYLMSANLGGANLINADIRNADLRRADLRNADLMSANLNGAYLRNADLRDANLRDANLRNADLRGADLGGVDLRNADLGGADLRRADLRNVKYNERTAFFALICPEEGDFIAWKKVGSVIIKMRVPAEAKRSSSTTRKCRCEYAEVLELQNLDGTPYDDDNVVNNRYVETIYKVGEIVHPDSWDDNRWNECSNGIHFFMTRDEAVRYQL